MKREAPGVSKEMPREHTIGALNEQNKYFQHNPRTMQKVLRQSAFVITPSRQWELKCSCLTRRYLSILAGFLPQEKILSVYEFQAPDRWPRVVNNHNYAFLLLSQNVLLPFVSTMVLKSLTNKTLSLLRLL